MQPSKVLIDFRGRKPLLAVLTNELRIDEA